MVSISIFLKRQMFLEVFKKTLENHLSLELTQIHDNINDFNKKTDILIIDVGLYSSLKENPRKYTNCILVLVDESFKLNEFIDVDGVVPDNISCDEILIISESIFNGYYVEHPTTKKWIHERTVFDSLSKQEYQVLTLLSKGFTNKEIAASLFLAEGTIKAVSTKLYEKLGVCNRVEASNLFNKHSKSL